MKMGLLLPLALFGAWQAAVQLGQVAERQLNYRAAEAEARRRGKPLLVVGGPLGSNPLRRLLPLPAHPCGNTCFDLDPAACRHCRRSVQGDVRDLSMFRDRQFGVAFVSHVLEHMPTIEGLNRAVVELARVADVVYVVGPRKASLIAWLIPSHHLWVRVEDGLVIAEQRR